MDNNTWKTKTPLDLKKMSGWSLDKVVEECRGRPANINRPFSYRASLTMLETAIRELCKDRLFNCQRRRLTRYLTFHGWLLARVDQTLLTVLRLDNIVSKEILLGGNTLKSAISMAKTGFSPETLRDIDQFDVWNGKIRSDFDSWAVTCGVDNYQLSQIYAVKSILTLREDIIGDTIGIFNRHVQYWNDWLDNRAWYLYCLAADKVEREKRIADFIEAQPGAWFTDMLADNSDNQADTEDEEE
jgi:hypothetical protein